MQDAAALPTNESTNYKAKNEKLLQNKVHYRDRKINELTMEVMTHKEKEHIFLNMEYKSLLIVSKAEEYTAAALAKLGAVKG